jgi:hypothetical protein
MKEGSSEELTIYRGTVRIRRVCIIAAYIVAAAPDGKEVRLTGRLSEEDAEAVLPEMRAVWTEAKHV